MPYVAVVGMKDMGAVFVDADSVFVIIVIRIAADMLLAVNNRHFLIQFFGQLACQRSAAETAADDQILYLSAHTVSPSDD